MAAGKKKEMTLVAAAKPQLKKRAKRDWSKAKAESFLTALGETCNVSEACRRSGVPMTVAYRRRKMDAAFRAEWIERIGATDPAQGRQRRANARIFQPARFEAASDAPGNGDRSE